ncbi:diguanylate cyclase [Thermomonas sp.]|uniref:diguanylate cyclase n=1 Tax=Thermomonas sp. TaxID=1971895 RepID=UPI0024893B20|nr:diguanylate cyclase [Thermomonas sp.]MDI1253110.1 diguanylate cyclase [Thermomonas sp.]
MSIRAAATETTPASPIHLQTLPKRVYRFRTLGMGLGFLPISAVLIELDASWPAWTWAAFCCLLWPHLAYQLASRNADPFHAELRNLTIDSALAGSLVSLMHFNLLPSVVLLTVVSADKINTGVRGLWLRSLPGMLIGMLAVGILTGFSMQPATSTTVLLASLPILIIHTLAVSLSSYQLIRKVQSQNMRLDELSRVDTLTGLESRGHWQEQVSLLLASHLAGTAQASMLLIDVDRFKQINDHHGHAMGDDVLRAIAIAIEAALPPGSHAGRIGGDEFAVAVPVDEQSARQIASTILARVEALQFARIPPLRCSVSIGIAEPICGDHSLRAWLEAADHALYRAKAAGRNRIASRETTRLRTPVHA